MSKPTRRHMLAARVLALLVMNQHQRDAALRNDVKFAHDLAELVDQELRSIAAAILRGVK